MASTEAVKQVVLVKVTTCQPCRLKRLDSGEHENVTILGHVVRMDLAKELLLFRYDIQFEGHICKKIYPPSSLKCDRLLSEYWKKVDEKGIVLDVLAQEERAAVMMRVASAEQEKVEAMMRAATEAKEEVERLQEEASVANKTVVSKKRKTQ